MVLRPVAQKLTWTLTSTGASTGTAIFGTGMSAAALQYSNPSTSTKASIKMQGSIGGSAVWSDLCAVTTLTTAEGLINSTATATFDKVRLRIKGKTTNAGTGVAWVIAR